MTKQIKISIDFKGKGLPLYVADLVADHLHLLALCLEKGVIDEHGYNSYLRTACGIQMPDKLMSYNP